MTFICKFPGKLHPTELHWRSEVCALFGTHLLADQPLYVIIGLTLITAAVRDAICSVLPLSGSIYIWTTEGVGSNLDEVHRWVTQLVDAIFADSHALCETRVLIPAITAVWQYPPDSGGVARRCCAAPAVPLHVLSIKFRVNSEACTEIVPPCLSILKSDFPTLYLRVYVALWSAVLALSLPLTPSERLLYPSSPRTSQPSSTKGLVLRFVVVVPL
ncbi:hypothetical protein OE88DRAFT_1801023 [Heliocybe sulcata]|uniref:Uncharacterized protein n=1 Tax=Heliocybe sulcata TaxID=5364 RepID=A0A5C3N4T3_9AGAM|nr:hypothetical protein OE88DRAFT_1801023 [Heliocybe sulcata]